jgi:stage III sporulation protein AG
LDNVKQQISKLIQQYKFVAIILLLGMMLMLLPSKNTQEAPISETNAATIAAPSAELEQILSQIQGVGRVRVLLTEAQGEQIIYVVDRDRSESGDSSSLREQAVVISGNDRTQQGLVSQVLPPTYLGAVIVCQGGDQPGVRLAVVEAVCDATGLSADKISVLKMK